MRASRLRSQILWNDVSYVTLKDCRNPALGGPSAKSFTYVQHHSLEGE